jgi:hypothetical protein
MDLLRRLEQLASQCVVGEHEAASRADRLREQAEEAEVDEDLYDPDDEGAIKSAREIMADHRKQLLDRAAKEDAEARKWAVRHSYATRGMLYLGPDELSDPDCYPSDLYNVCINRNVAFITSERMGPLGESEDDQAV